MVAVILYEDTTIKSKIKKLWFKQNMLSVKF